LRKVQGWLKQSDARRGLGVNLRLDVLQSWLSPFPARYMIRALKARFRDQKAEFDVIQQHVKPGDTVCDIGANKGSFTYWLSRWCHEGSVVAFEPQAGLAEYLAKACETFQLHNVKVEAKGVYSRSIHLGRHLIETYWKATSIYW
jgi:tRNA G46 methylase TrmB